MFGIKPKNIKSVLIEKTYDARFAMEMHRGPVKSFVCGHIGRWFESGSRRPLVVSFKVLAEDLLKRKIAIMPEIFDGL
jgi:hypothetical protein